jgi:hypothetical protein
VREHATHWVIGGTLLAATGFAPEDWLAHTVHGLHIPDNILHLLPAGLDARIVPVAVGMAVIALALLPQRHPSSSPSLVCHPSNTLQHGLRLSGDAAVRRYHEHTLDGLRKAGWQG